MRQYETIIIIDADQSAEQVQNFLQKTQATIEKYEGKLVKQLEWGRRRLAYPIRKKKYGIYYVFYLEGEFTLPQELNRFFRIEENVLRFQSVRIETSIEEEAKFFSELIHGASDDAGDKEPLDTKSETEQVA